MLDRVARWLSAGEMVILLLTGPLFLFFRPAFAPALLLFPLLWLARHHDRGYLVPRSPVDWPILGLMVMVLLSLFATPDPLFSSRKVVGMVYGVAVFYAIIEWGRRQGSVLPTSALVSILGCGAALLALLGTEWVFKLPVLSRVVSGLPAVIRGMPGAESGFNPNQVSGALIMFIPVQAVLFWDAVSRARLGQRRSVWPVVGTGLALAVTSTVVVVAQSRAAWGALLLGLLGASAIVSRRARLFVAILLALAVVGIVVLWPAGAGGWLARQAWAVSPEETSWASRVELWSRGLWTIADYPLTGTGMNMFRLIAARSLPLFHFEYGRDIGHSHQTYIQVALDLGLPGLVFYLALVFGTLASGWLSYRHAGSGPARQLALASVTAVTIHAIWGIADAIALGAKQSFLWWSMLALAATIAIHVRRACAEEADSYSLEAAGQKSGNS